MILMATTDSHPRTTQASPRNGLFGREPIP